MTVGHDAVLIHYLDRALRHWPQEERDGKPTQFSENRDLVVGRYVDKWLRDCDLSSAMELEPVRTFHHFSCTGGTLFSKSIASMSNILVLNEIDLISTMSMSNDHNFTPTDMVSLLRQGDPHMSIDVLIRLFQQDLAIIREEQWRIGRSLILRDHTHSHFLVGETVDDRPTFKDMVEARFPILSLVTVRDPVDSYASMRKHGWHNMMTPSTFTEYCNRYTVFLDRYKDVPIVKYEDFVANPSQFMKKICEYLRLNYFDGFLQVFDVHRFSGDSGRSGSVIEPRPRRELDSELKEEINHAGADYQRLCERLGYEVWNE